MFSIQDRAGRDLQPIRDSGANPRIDSFVTLSDDKGSEDRKDAHDLRDIPSRGGTGVRRARPSSPCGWLPTVWDRKLVGDHNLCGRAYLRLDPRYFAISCRIELWMDLDTKAAADACHMEGERDDILTTLSWIPISQTSRER